MNSSGTNPRSISSKGPKSEIFLRDITFIDSAKVNLPIEIPSCKATRVSYNVVSSLLETYKQAIPTGFALPGVASS